MHGSFGRDSDLTWKSSVQRPKVTIVGAGFGGLSAARALGEAPVEITLIDRKNYHLFQPLLYQVATAALSPADIAWPIRQLVRHQRNTCVILGEVIKVDPARKVVNTREMEFSYDFLVLATGAAHSYFGKDEWAPYAPGLKSIENATEIRRRILIAFERAEMEQDPKVRSRLLTFVIVGGGPTGVEMAGAIAELARKALAADFRNIDPQQTQVLLIEAGPRILPAYSENSSHYAEIVLTRLGVDLRLGHPVTDCHANGVAVSGRHIEAGTIIWAAGVAASPAATWLGVPADSNGRVLVGPQLTAPGHDDVFVIGDTAVVLDNEGKPLPGVAPVAKQEGAYVANVIEARIVGKKQTQPFNYHNRGMLATIGRRAAIIEFGVVKLKGRLAWWIWGLVHIYFLISLRSRLIVATQWLWSYITFERGARLITGLDSNSEAKGGDSSSVT